MVVDFLPEALTAGPKSRNPGVGLAIQCLAVEQMTNPTELLETERVTKEVKLSH